jgi:hypothetical protein
VIENFRGRIAEFIRCQPLFGNGDVFVGEPMCHVSQAPAPRRQSLPNLRFHHITAVIAQIASRFRLS